MALSACEVLNSQGELSAAQLARELNYSEATTVNIITDLQNLALCGKGEGGKHALLNELDIKMIPERIRSQFIEHVLYQSILQSANEHDTLSRSRATDLVRSLYSGADVKPTTRDNYLTRLIPWLEYAGLVESDGDQLRVFSVNKSGYKYGVQPSRGRASNGSVFLASAPPEITKKLFLRLVEKGVIERENISSEHLRNSVQDLSALGLARRASKGLIATVQILAPSTPEEVFVRAVVESEAIIMLNKLLKENPNAPRKDIGVLLGVKLGKNWKSSSAVRYANGLLRYREYIIELKACHK